MKRYETIFISRVNQPEEELAAQIKKYEGILAREKGVHIGTKRWGQRRLAYDINKQSLGYYVLVDWAGLSPVVAEFERNLKIDDRILKFMTVKKKDKISPAEIEAEIAALQAAPAQPVPAAPTPVAVPEPAAEPEKPAEPDVLPEENPSAPMEEEVQQ